MTYYEIYAELEDYRDRAESFKGALNKLMDYTNLSIYKVDELLWVVKPSNNKMWDDRSQYFRSRYACLENVKIKTGFYIKRVG